MNEWMDELTGIELLKLQYLATWCEQPTQWKRRWCWKRLKAEREQADRGWDGWMASPIQWTWTWANSGRCWGSGRPVPGLTKCWAWLGDWTTENEFLGGTDIGPRDFTFSLVFSSAQQRLLVKYLNRTGCRLTQSCLTLCDPMDCSPPGFSAHRILQARILEWVAMPSSRGSSPLGDQTHISWIADRFFTLWATREAYSGLLRGKDEVWSQLKGLLGSWVPGLG